MFVKVCFKPLKNSSGFFFFHSGPPGLKMEGADQAVAKATGLKVGRYTFRLTVSDQQGAKDNASLTVRVQEGKGWV